MRLLLVEDEPTLREQLTAHFRAAGFAVDAAANATDGEHLGREYPVDAAIIDIGLPDFSGVELIRRLRKAERSFPILILTARSKWQEKVEGLEAGADDYLTKPFHNEELLARINALLRRSAGRASAEINVGAYAINTAAKAVHCDGRPVDLTAYEYRLLEYLAMHAGRPISKSELTEHVYDEDMDRDSNVIEVLVGRLRRKLDPDGTQKPIVTERGRGYRFG